LTLPGRSAIPILQVACALAAMCLVGCEEDPMLRRGRIKPLKPTEFFADGRSTRSPLPGTIARGQLPQDVAYHSGRTPDGQWIQHAPIPLTLEVLRRGQERFNAFCAPCHGQIGDSNGMIVLRGFSTPPTFHSDRMRQVPDGHVFDVISDGYGKMPAHRHQIPVADRWAIIAYMRALQRSQHATLDDVPAERRSDLMEVRP
jgi:hypothetical protein